MKFYQALTAACLSIASIQAIAVGPELSKEDLKELSGGNLRKGPLLLSPMDNTAQVNIKSTLKYMEFANPVALPSDPKKPNVLHYQVNPNSDKKIEKVCLSSANIKDLRVAFQNPDPKKVSAPIPARWDINDDKDDVRIKAVPAVALSQKPEWWMFSLGVNNLSDYTLPKGNSHPYGNLYMDDEGNYVLAHRATDTASFGYAEKENWFDVYVKFNPSKAYIQHYTYQEEKKTKTFPYILGQVVLKNDFNTLLKKGKFSLVKEANPIIK